jgi:hypothetical protein
VWIKIIDQAEVSAKNLIVVYEKTRLGFQKQVICKDNGSATQVMI